MSFYRYSAGRSTMSKAARRTTRPNPIVSAFDAAAPPKLLCPLCSGELIRRHTKDLRGRDVPFWGCAGWKSAARCRYTLGVDVFETAKGRLIAKWHDTLRLDACETA